MERLVADRPLWSKRTGTLGAPAVRRWRTYISEARVGVTLAVLTAFARCVTELGIAMMIGGNIRGRTRTLATAIAMEGVRKGHQAVLTRAREHRGSRRELRQTR